MDLSLHNKEKSKAKVKCPECGSKKVKVLMFMGAQPDGYVCESCNAVLDLDTLRVLGRKF